MCGVSNAARHISYGTMQTLMYIHTCHAMPFHSIDVWMLCISVMCRYCMYVCVVVVVVLQVYRGSSDSNCQSVAYTRLKTIDILLRGQPALPVLRLCMYVCMYSFFAIFLPFKHFHTKINTYIHTYIQYKYMHT